MAEHSEISMIGPITDPAQEKPPQPPAASAEPTDQRQGPVRGFFWTFSQVSKPTGTTGSCHLIGQSPPKIALSPNVLIRVPSTNDLDPHCR